MSIATPIVKVSVPEFGTASISAPNVVTGSFQTDGVETITYNYTLHGYTITATPNIGYVFAGWRVHQISTNGIQGSGTDDNTYIEMANPFLTPTEQPSHLGITSPAQVGEVSSTDEEGGTTTDTVVGYEIEALFCVKGFALVIQPNTAKHNLEMHGRINYSGVYSGVVDYYSPKLWMNVIPNQTIYLSAECYAPYYQQGTVFRGWTIIKNGSKTKIADANISIMINEWMTVIARFGCGQILKSGVYPEPGEVLRDVYGNVVMC